MSDRNDAYRVLARRLKELRPHDFLDVLLPVAGAADAVATLERLAARAEAAGDLADARRLKVEALRARAAYDHAVHHVVEAIAEEPGGADLVSALMGGDGRTLAEILLG
jgi:hypothetical protein